MGVFALEQTSRDVFTARHSCRQIHLTRHFSHALLHTIRCAYHTAWLKTSHPTCLYVRVIPSSCHPRCVFDRSLSVSSCLSLSCFSPSFTSSLPHSACTLPSTSSPVSTASRETIAAPSHNEESCPMAIYHPLTTPPGTKVFLWQRMSCPPPWWMWDRCSEAFAITWKAPMVLPVT